MADDHTFKHEGISPFLFSSWDLGLGQGFGPQGRIFCLRLGIWLWSLNLVLEAGILALGLDFVLLAGILALGLDLGLHG